MNALRFGCIIKRREFRMFYDSGAEMSHDDYQYIGSIIDKR